MERTAHSVRIVHPSGAGSPSWRWSARLLVSILAASSVAFSGCKDPRSAALAGDASTMDAPVDQAIGHAGASGAAGSSSGGGGEVADAGMDVAVGNGGAAGGAPGSGGVLGSGGASGGAGGAHASGGAAGNGGVGSGGMATGGGGAIGSGGVGGGMATGGGGAIGSGGLGDTGGSSGATCTAPGSCGTTCKPANQANAPLGTDCGTTGMVCDGSGSCVSKIANGSTCANNTLCQSGNCSAGTGGNICCQSGYANCGSCVNKQADANNCGTCGNMCGANKACSSGSCACTGATLMCGSCGSWSFDTASTEGWVPDTNPNFGVMGGGSQNGIENLTTSSSMKHDGSNAMAVVLNVSPVGGTNYASVAVPICSTNLGGTIMSAWVYFLGVSFDPQTFFWFTAWSATTEDRLPAAIGASIPVNQWTKLSITFDGVVADHVSIQLSPGTNWDGTMYIDTVTLTPP